MSGTLTMSAAVIAATTPGRARAARTSTERMRPCATELRRIAGMQNLVGRDIVDELSAAAQEAQIFQALDRTADEGVDRALAIHGDRAQMRLRTAGRQLTPRAHITIVAFSLSSARATLMAASAEVLGFERDGLPWS